MFMRKLFLGVLLATVANGLAAHGDDPPVIESISGTRVVELLKDAGFTDAATDEDDDVIVSMQGYRVLFFVGTYEGKNIGARFALAGTKATADTVNIFDREKRYGRVFLDDEGDPVLESDLDLEGGVTEARVRDFLRTYNELMVHFLRAVL
jgi:hypothetical protein